MAFASPSADQTSGEMEECAIVIGMLYIATHQAGGDKLFCVPTR